MTSSLRFHVWCLSWDDTEEDGSDVVGYDILNHDRSREERRTVYVPIYALGNASSAAEAYADYLHGHRDGNESTWPLVFRVRCSDGQILDFEVDREMVPEFSAVPAVKTANKKKVS